MLMCTFSIYICTHTSPPPVQSGVKWKQLADLATGKGQFGLAMECLHHAEDYGGLLLLATSAGDADTLARVGQQAAAGGYNNISFISNFLLGRLEECLEILVSSKRLPEAAFFARTYLPSQMSRSVLFHSLVIPSLQYIIAYTHVHVYTFCNSHTCDVHVVYSMCH